MEKINGYAREETEELVRYLSEGKKEGKTLTNMFSEYGKAHGRAGGSVRNYYYKLLKTREAQPILEGKHLQAEKILPFSEEETQRMLKSILTEKNKGYSVRRSIANVCGGDPKKMLRYQNKYRNMLKKQPQIVRAAAQEAGISPDLLVRPSKSALEKRVEAEINALYERLAFGLREENARLRETVRRLTDENELLRRSASSKSELRLRRAVPKPDSDENFGTKKSV